MSIGLILITHPGVASTLYETTCKMLGECPLPTHIIEAAFDCSTDDLKTQVAKAIDELDKDNGILILTDLYGSTPSNIGHFFLDDTKIKMVAGLNLPMLIRVMNYPSSKLNELVLKAVSGGHDGIVLCDCTCG